MTLKEFFDLLGDNPIIILSYFALIPFTALLAGVLGKGEGYISPWKYLYSALIYLVAVPGIFAVTLNIYLFVFERQSVFNMDVYTQVLPIVSMLATLLIIRRNVDLNYIPGFDRLGGLIMVVTAAIAIMWFIDRTRIYMISFVKFEYVLLMLVGLLILIRFGWSRVIGNSGRE